MKRSDLIKTREYWIADMQIRLYSIISAYQKENNLTRTQIAEKLGVTKGYISQVLNGDFDHKISKLVDLSLAFNKAPLLNYVNLDRFILDDEKDMAYDLIAMPRPRNVTYITTTQIKAESGSKKEAIKFNMGDFNSGKRMTESTNFSITTLNT